MAAEGVVRLAPEESSWRPEGVVSYKEVRVKKVAGRRNARFLPAEMLVCVCCSQVACMPWLTCCPQCLVGCLLFYQLVKMHKRSLKKAFFLNKTRKKLVKIHKNKAKTGPFCMPKKCFIFKFF